MRKLLYFTFTLALIAALTSYTLWTRERPIGHYLSDLRIQLAVDQGTPADHGNLLGIQPELFPTDYQSPERLHRKLAAYLQQARDQGLLNEKTVVVLPEHIGTWLMVSGEKNELYQAASLKEAMNWLAVSNPLPFLRALITAKGDNRLNDAHLRMKARSMAEQYQRLFGGLAKEFGITLVAGSIVLPEPVIEGSNLRIGSGALYNTTLVFGSDGLPIGQPQRQLYPTFDERGFIQASADQAVQVVDTPAGRLGVLIGSDSWYPDNYRKLNAQGAQLVAVPAFVMGRGAWDRPWRGYKNLSTPSEVSLKPEEVSEGEAWRRLTLTSRAPSSLASAGVSVFLRGQFWDQGSAGQSFINSNGEHFADGDARGARLLNIWL
ncbi:Hydrolase, carbon-nitrogen family [Pseudomonas chlororaphis subsp. aurantiaca]|jgi:predicted amidohydrolase|uniref:Hydrolase, carbon-nitrogen family n=2 Tax=Pseudomonas chlororaphis TaxID=587753 RepID=A0A3G7TRS6_9PSED|nr:MULTISPECIES: carbon-nitrogen hydrolase family protein [Pseudomonas]AIS12245.1 carbon-nitrogen hydrolase [Pseudomonas chlororaphis subsp. aurantiaca]AZD36848.1 Hydrolase, carbon-nitrogen family [Pseudomonas chlororaphis subsp. aurantiaca]AZD43187.1 Hydrolase, carbon-nitrogen family [Pseudomonas chlororaphis subsp. aurantiaca]AZD80553.1 Hydrolase, carbon-nitrogen family [Pseudomonas chlororaphis subsp. aurantiaca]AZD87261.1 Hydrolase, carbon-nitrogen family [Pseudomonas chlororaphis subsp. a